MRALDAKLDAFAGLLKEQTPRGQGVDSPDVRRARGFIRDRDQLVQRADCSARSVLQFATECNQIYSGNGDRNSHHNRSRRTRQHVDYLRTKQLMWQATRPAPSVASRPTHHTSMPAQSGALM